MTCKIVSTHNIVFYCTKLRVVSKSQSIVESLNNYIVIHTMGCYLAVKNVKVISFLIETDPGNILLHKKRGLKQCVQ